MVAGGGSWMITFSSIQERERKGESVGGSAQEV